MRFTATLLLAFLTPLFLMGSVIFVVDPLMALHRPWYDEPVYYHDERYMLPGLIKWQSPNTIVVGPSTIQPFQADILQAAGLENGLNVSIAAATLREQRLTVELGLAGGQLKRVVWGVEWVTVAWPPEQVADRFGPFPHFLYDKPERLLKDYLLEPHFLGLSLEALAVRFFGHNSPSWSNDREATKRESTSREYGLRPAIKDYFTVLNSQEVEAALNDPARVSQSVFKENFNQNLVDFVQNNPKLEFEIFLPPNSILQMSLLERNYPIVWKNFVWMLEALSNLDKLPNVKVHNFYDAQKYYMSLKRYRDIQHFDRDTALEILQDIKGNRYRLKSADDTITSLIGEIRRMREQCPDEILTEIIENSPQHRAIKQQCIALLGG